MQIEKLKQIITLHEANPDSSIYLMVASDEMSDHPYTCHKIDFVETNKYLKIFLEDAILFDEDEIIEHYLSNGADEAIAQELYHELPTGIFVFTTAA